MTMRYVVFLIYLVLAASVACTLPLPLKMAESWAGILSIGISLIAAGFIPTISMLIGSMTEEGRSPKILIDLHKHLHRAMMELAIAFGLAILSIIFISVTIALSYADNAPHSFQRFSIGLTIWTVFMFLDRALIMFKEFFLVLDWKKEQALWSSKKKIDAFIEQAQKDVKFSPDDYGSQTRTTPKNGTSD